MSFSSEIKAVRQKVLLSQEAFAKELGVSFTTVNRWESGKCRPSYKTLRQISDYCRKNNIAFDPSAEFLVSGEEAEEQHPSAPA